MAAGNMPKISSLPMRENYLKARGKLSRRVVGKVAKAVSDREGRRASYRQTSMWQGSSSSKWQVAS